MSETARQADRLSPATRTAEDRGLFHDYAAVIATPWPAVKLGIIVRDDAVICIDFLSGEAPLRVARDELIREALWQLRAYFRDPQHRFSLPLAPSGTAFQRRVWEALQRIPAGATLSYGELARRLGSSARAIGGACRANPIPVIIPCHRVVAAQGLGGFMGVTEGRGLHLKQCLLAHESFS
jgi:methylated-DNA-[protein]-cysteine S-methyltransferase